MEYVIHVPPVRCARLVEGAAELLGKVLALPCVHRPHGGLQVHLVGDEDHGDVLGGSHLGDEVAVLHSLVKTMSEKGKPFREAFVTLWSDPPPLSVTENTMYF